jgi:hypothetical protein
MQSQAFKSTAVLAAILTTALAALAPARAADTPAATGFVLDGLKVTTVGPSGPPAMRVDIVIVGDGYVKEDFAPGGRWQVDTARLVKLFFEKVPFKQLRHLFNVHLVEAVSLDRGADDSPAKDVKRTPFDCAYGADGVDRALVVRDEDALQRAVANAPAADIILVLVNDIRLGGTGGTAPTGVPHCTISSDGASYLVAIHELGHSFAGLGDEYVDPQVAGLHALPESGDIEYPNLTVAKLVDTSTRESLVRTIKWGRKLRTPEGSGERGFFEGGYYLAKGVYRPAATCVMMDQNGGGKYCYVCQDELVRAIYRSCKRGPGGGFAGVPVADIEPTARLANALSAYDAGRFAAVVGELKKIEKKETATQADRDGAAKLRAAIEASFAGGCDELVAMQGAGDARGVKEYASLFQEAFKGTDWEGRAKEKRLASK